MWNPGYVGLSTLKWYERQFPTLKRGWFGLCRIFTLFFYLKMLSVFVCTCAQPMCVSTGS